MKRAHWQHKMNTERLFKGLFVCLFKGLFVYEYEFKRARGKKLWVSKKVGGCIMYIKVISPIFLWHLSYLFQKSWIKKFQKKKWCWNKCILWSSNRAPIELYWWDFDPKPTWVVPPTKRRPDFWPRGASTYCLARYVTFSLYVTVQHQPTSWRILELYSCWFIWPYPRVGVGSLAGLRPIYCAPSIRVK